MNGTRVPSGRSATASCPRTGRPSLRVTAIGHSACGMGVPSGQNSRPVTHQSSLPSYGAASGEIRSSLIVVGDLAGGIGRVDRHRKSLEYVQVVTARALAEIPAG